MSASMHPPMRWEESLLREAAAAAMYPPVPDVRGRVLTALREGAGERPRAPRVLRLPVPSRRLAGYALAAVAGIVVAAALALPGARSGLAEWLGLVEGQRIERIPAATPAVEPTVRPTWVPSAGFRPRLDGTPTVHATPSPYHPLLGEAARRVTLAEAHVILEFEPVLPAGEPEGLFAVVWAGQPLLVATYEGFDLWQTECCGWFGKGISEDIIITQETVNGRPAYWIHRSDHEVAFYDANGVEVLGSRRTLQGNLLTWRGEERHYRLETELPLEEALRLAESLP